MKLLHILIIGSIVFLPTRCVINLSGLYLTRNDISLFNKANNIHLHSLLFKKINEQNPILYENIKTNFMWHLRVETTGFYADKNSSYIPYRFNLWDLAPKKGAGVTVALLDTGVAAFELIGGKNCTRHPNLTSSAFDPYENYNCSAQGLQTFVNHLKNFLMPAKNLSEREIIPMVVEYCSTGKTDLLISLLQHHGKSDLFSNNGTLSNYGTKAIQELTQGRRGMLPGGKTRFFSIEDLVVPVQKKIICEFLPMPSMAVLGKGNKCIAAHGTHLYGLINAVDYEGVCGIAPHAQIIMLKICNEGGISDAQTVLYALKKAHAFNVDIINMSLKVENENNELCKAIEDKLKLFMFVVAASGNDRGLEKNGDKEAFPANLTSIPFDIGAFSYDGSSYQICPFSQYEEKIGPKFVAPGFNILSTGIPSTAGDYLFLSGTSMATALMSGFIALMLAEFKNDFTREQLLKVCYACTKRLGSNPDWYERTLLGVLDMRTALFTLHICKALKNKTNKKTYDRFFDRYVGAVLIMLHEIEKNPRLLCGLYGNLEKIIDFFVTFISMAEKNSKLKTFDHELFEAVQSIFLQKSFDLFSAYDRTIRERLCSSNNPV